MYQKIDLDNGLRIILNPMPHKESASIGVWIDSGSRNENEDISGISHFLEHLVFKGTRHRTGRRIKEEIEGRGGSLNGFTSEEITCYLAKVSGRHINIALSVLSDMVLYATLNTKDIERERAVIIEEIKMYKDLPHQYVQEILCKTMWPDHPLGLSVAGTIKSVSSIKRHDIMDYRNKIYAPKNITVILCGNFNSSSIVKKIKKLYGSNIRTRRKPIVKFNNAQTKPQIKVLYKDTAQTHLSMGLHGFGRMHRDKYVMVLLHIILGANMSSRLFENVREKKGLAYEIGTGVKTYKDTGAFIVNAGIEHKKVKEAVSLIISELRKIKTELVSETELKRAKEYFKVQLLLSLEDTMDYMMWLGGHIVPTGKFPDKDKIIRKMDSITSSDLRDAAKSIFNSENLNLALIGTIEDTDRKAIEKEMAL